jgi:hypothetical protein
MKIFAIKRQSKACLIPDDVDWLDSSIGPGELLLVVFDLLLHQF